MGAVQTAPRIPFSVRLLESKVKTLVQSTTLSSSLPDAILRKLQSTVMLPFDEGLRRQLNLYCHLYHCTSTRNSAGFPVAEKAVFGHLMSIFTASRQMVECSPNGHGTATLAAAQQPSVRSWNNRQFILIFVSLLSLLR